MIETKLILLEGPPGSGKTTTTQKLASEISDTGQRCQYFLEWSSNNPIVIGDDAHLAQVIATSITREEDVLQHWQRFAEAMQTEGIVTVMESRFWQTTLMLMYATGSPLQNSLESNQRVIKIIQKLKPVLIYFSIDDPKEFALRTTAIKDEEWQLAGYPNSWTQHIIEAFESQKWCTDRGVTGLDGVFAFLEEWARVTEELYEGYPFAKIRIRNPHHGWTFAMNKMLSFLDLN